jgi:hypothetical protein
VRIRDSDLAYWYLRLNGFLTIPNFVLHPETGGSQRTEVDVIGVRFPHRSELSVASFQDDPGLALPKEKSVLVLAQQREANAESTRLGGAMTRTCYPSCRP